jgi:hypothetical protein
MFTTLQKMKYFIGSAFGVSTTSFTGDAVPFQGLGQGNGAGLTGWAVASAPIINMLCTAGYGATFVTVLSCAGISFVCYAFVDNTDLVHTRPGDKVEGVELIPEMQEAVDHWEGGLRATGGALVPSKSHRYLIDFQWKNGSWHYQSKADSDHTEARVPLERVEMSEAHRSLGLMIAGDGKWEAEVKYLLQASIDWRANLQAGHLSKADAWYALNHTINRTVEYPMMAMSLSKAQCETVMRPFLNAGLSASGVARSMPRAVVWGPLRYQGLAIWQLYTMQGIQHLLALLWHGSDTPHSDRTTPSHLSGRTPIGNRTSVLLLIIQALHLRNPGYSLLARCYMAVLIGVGYHGARSLSQTCPSMR